MVLYGMHKCSFVFETGNSIDIHHEYCYPGLGPIGGLAGSREVKLSDVTRGIHYVNTFQLAHVLYGPSYVSFQAALCYWDIIPEYAYHVVCATCKRDEFTIHVNGGCSYYYERIPQEVFTMYVDTWYDEDGSVFCHLATREKAVCDQLYSLPDMEDVDELQILMFEDQRFDEDDIAALNRSWISDLADHYGSRNVTLLDEYLGSF